MTYDSKDQIAKWMEESAVPALHVIPADAGARSKIGGLPQLAEGPMASPRSLIQVQ